jgi:predicted metal-dependent hydrolase
VPGLNVRPEEEATGFDWGIDLYHAGYLWEAHEAWEGVWKSESDPVRRAFVQGLIQMAASLLKAHVGEERGSARLAERALRRFRSCGRSCMGLDVTGIVAALESGGPAPRLVDATQ